MFTIRASQQTTLAQEGIDRLKSDAIAVLREFYADRVDLTDPRQLDTALNAAMEDARRLRLERRNNTQAYLVLALRFRTSLLQLRADPATGGVLRNASLNETDKIYLIEEILSQR